MDRFIIQPMRCISLLTDFGLQDTFVGVMKGVIYGIAPEVRIVDLSHQVQPQNILQGAVLLGDAWRYFPSGSIHLAVVDPDVGTQRLGMSARIGGHYFVAPNNGLLSAVFEQAEQSGHEVLAVRLENERYWLPSVSRTFHGRDIFAPVAAHLAAGVELESLGGKLDSPARIAIPRPQRTDSGWHGEVLMIDRFGNLITNVRIEHLESEVVGEVRLAGAVVRRMAATFGEANSGELISLLDSSGRLSISLVNGSAMEELGVGVGDEVEVVLASPWRK